MWVLFFYSFKKLSKESMVIKRQLDKVKMKVVLNKDKCRSDLIQCLEFPNQILLSPHWCKSFQNVDFAC